MLLGTGTGSFGAATVFTAGATRMDYYLAVADVNGDGKLDVLTANYGYSTASVLLGTGTGTFSNAITFSTGNSSAPRAIAVADVNGDGKLDMLTANSSNNALGVLLGTGTGNFGTVSQYSTGAGSTPYAIAVADVNGDGKLDVLTANYGNSTASVLLGTGTGTFGNAITFSTGNSSTPYAIAVADVNGDGKLDVLTANYGNSTSSVLLGTGTGSFGAATSFSTDANSTPRDIVVADVNGDHRPDLLTANYHTGTIGVLLNAGTYTPLTAPAGLAAAAVAL